MPSQIRECFAVVEAYGPSNYEWAAQNYSEAGVDWFGVITYKSFEIGGMSETANLLTQQTTLTFPATVEFIDLTQLWIAINADLFITILRRDPLAVSPALNTFGDFAGKVVSAKASSVSIEISVSSLADGVRADFPWTKISGNIINPSIIG